MLYQNLYVRRSEKTGIVPVSGTDDVIVEDGQPAGHAVCAVGYDDDKQTVIIRNSWEKTGEIKDIVISHMNYLKWNCARYVDRSLIRKVMEVWKLQNTLYVLRVA